MLLELLEREACRNVRYLEATVRPSDTASRAMLQALARQLNTTCEEGALFAPSLFGDEDHEEERLLRVGPFTVGRAAIGAGLYGAERKRARPCTARTSGG